MDSNKKIAFIDIEANQHKDYTKKKTEHFILEYSVFSVEKDEVFLSNECRCKYLLSKRLCKLLNKTSQYYLNIRKTEKQCYEELLKISKDYNLLCFGTYDQTILDSAAERYNLEKIKLINYVNEINKIFEFPKSSSISLYQLKTLLEISFKNEKQHSSYWDAKILKEIYIKIQNTNNFDHYKNYLSVEKFRPKYYQASNYKESIYLNVPQNYSIFLMKCIKKEFPDEHKKTLTLNIKKYNQKFELLKSYDEFIENYYLPEGVQKFNEFKNIVLKDNKNFASNLFVFDDKKILPKFFKINNVSFYAPYRISEKTFMSLKTSDIQKINIINKFYSDGKFEKLVNYSEILKNIKR